MHEILHIAILVSTLLGAAALVLLVLWPVFGETPLSGLTRNALFALVVIAACLLVVEWRFVH
ncbi:MAG TPA: hypothetical protein VJ927_05995 [Actinomycetota bacterium]|nr:hypothetical protein [Actinomycetota bacterium]